MQCHFFALADDLVPVLGLVERIPLEYAPFGDSDNSSCTVYTSGVSLPTLAVPAPHPNASAGFTYLVAARGTGFSSRRIDMADGSHRYSFDQLVNPKTVCITHGGVFGARLLLYGRVATASHDADSVRLHRRFSSAIRKHFRKVQAFWVGPSAVAALRDGWRLTIGANSPAEYDLAEHPHDA
jgi:hypothetical protein